MARAFLAIVLHDLSLACRRRGSALSSLLFFIIVCSLFPLALGPEPQQLRTLAPGIPTKTGMMMGLGEERDEVIQVFKDLRQVGVSILTLGQYLRPSANHAVMTRYYGANRSWREGLRMWPFALFAAFAMTIPYVVAAFLLGPEFPTLVGSLTGLAIVVAAARMGFLVPPASRA